MLIWWEFCQTIFTQHTLKILCERSVQGPAALPFGENGGRGVRRSRSMGAFVCRLGVANLISCFQITTYVYLCVFLFITLDVFTRL